VDAFGPARLASGEAGPRRGGEVPRKGERFHQERALSKRASQSYTELLQDLLEKVRGTEEVPVFQVDGGGAPDRRAVREDGFSVLVAAGAHAERSVHVVRYERAELHESGMPFDLTWELRGGNSARTRRPERNSRPSRGGSCGASPQ
jgi:hypothetical protein